MRELLYTILELEEWNQGATCRFCSNLFGDNKAVCQIRTRSKATNSIVANNYACENCKEKFENDELPKCEKCGRLKTNLDIDVSCDCIRKNEDLEEKELPSLPQERESMTAFYERQINQLREEKNQLTEEIDTHLEALEISEVWNKRQKQELLDEIKKLKEKVKQLEEQNKQLKEQSGIANCEKEIIELRKQLEQTNQQLAQIEVPSKDKGIKGFFKFGGKK